jgi:hypothetical protein
MKKLLLASVAALFLATGAAHAETKCDTEHTSDTRRIWQCGSVCVKIYGNPGHREIAIDGVDWPAAADIHLHFYRDPSKASLNGKQCKELPQTYDYEKQK